MSSGSDVDYPFDSLVRTALQRSEEENACRRLRTRNSGSVYTNESPYTYDDAETQANCEQSGMQPHLALTDHHTSSAGLSLILSPLGKLPVMGRRLAVRMAHHLRLPYIRRWA